MQTLYRDPLLTIAGAVERIDERTDHIAVSIDGLMSSHQELDRRVTRLEARSTRSPAQWLRDNRDAALWWIIAGALATGNVSLSQVIDLLK